MLPGSSGTIFRFLMVPQNAFLTSSKGQPLLSSDVSLIDGQVGWDKISCFMATLYQVSHSLNHTQLTCKAAKYLLSFFL